MKHDTTTLSTTLDRVAAFWSYNGQLMVQKDGQWIHESAYGYADRETQLITRPDTRYALHSESQFLLTLCLLRLVDQGKIKLTDLLSSFIPEYRQGHRMTIEHLMRSQSGIPDFFYSKLMVQLTTEDHYLALKDGERRCFEQQILYKNRSFEQVLTLIGEEALAYEPGTVGYPGSMSNEVFMAEILRRITGLSVLEALRSLLFEPLQMNGITYGNTPDAVSYLAYNRDQLARVALENDIEGVFTASAEDFKPLMAALASKQLFSKSLWRQMLRYDEEGNSLVFENANGYACNSVEFLGFGFYLYFNHKSRLAFACLANAQQTMKHIDGQWCYIRRALRETIDAAWTFPAQTKMVRLNKANLWHALNIKVSEDQLDFVLEAKSSIAMALMYKTKRGFVQMEGHRVIGLLVLDLDHKNAHYNIDIIQIDEQFQGRGYGKLMLDWAIQYLRKEGAKELEIGVNRRNGAAIKIYTDAGFAPKLINEGGMTLHMRFDENLTS